jgi:FtsH-binding integral membrane protein
MKVYYDAEHDSYESQSRNNRSHRRIRRKVYRAMVALICTLIVGCLCAIILYG